MIRVFFSLFLSLSVFLLFYVIINLYENYYYYYYYYYFIYLLSLKLFSFFNVPECSMFRILSTPDFSPLFHTERSWHKYRFTVVFLSGLRDFPSNSRAFSVTSVFEAKSI